MSARCFYTDPDDASAARETLAAFGVRAVMMLTTVVDLKTGCEQPEWEVVALDLPAQLARPGVVEPSPAPEIDEQDRISSYWWDDGGHGRDWDRD